MGSGAPITPQTATQLATVLQQAGRAGEAQAVLKRVEGGDEG